MKYLFLLLVSFLLCPSIASAQTKSMESYFNEFRPNDPSLQYYFPAPNERLKSFSELSSKERRQVKRHLRNHYGINPSANSGGYLKGTARTLGSTTGRTIIYIATGVAVAAAATGVINAMSK
jgi:hypothetical protein